MASRRAGLGCALLLLLAALSVAWGAGERTICEATYANYRDLPSIEVRNDLVTLVALPDLGGRIIQYRLGEHGFLDEHLPETANLLRPGARRETGDFGGAKAWVGAVGGALSPSAWLEDRERWLGEVMAAAGPKAVIQLVSPPDDRRLRLTRTFSLTREGSRVLVEHRIENLGRQPQESFVVEWVATAPPAARLGPSYQILLPVAPGDYQVRKGSGQAEYLPEAQLLRLKPGAGDLEVAAKVRAGWLICDDRTSGFVFVRRFRYFPNASYPEGGTTVVVKGEAGSPSTAGLLLGPLATLGPRESHLFALEWLAARCGRQPQGVAEAGVIGSPLRAARVGGKLVVTGSFGSFFLGRAELWLLDASGNRLGDPILLPGELTPLSPYEVNTALEASAGTAAVRLLALGREGTSLGELGRAPVK